MSDFRHDRPGFPEFVPSITDMLLIETSATCNESHLGHSQPFAMSNSRRSPQGFPEIEPSGTGILLPKTSSTSAFSNESYPGRIQPFNMEEVIRHMDGIIRYQVSCIVFFLNSKIVFFKKLYSLIDFYLILLINCYS